MVQGLTDQPRYNREFLTTWLNHWDELSSCAESDFEWADLKLSMLAAVNTMPIELQRVFHLHYVMGYGRKTIAQKMQSSLGLAQWRINAVSRRMVLLLEKKTSESVFTLKGAYPTAWTGGYIGPWDRV